MADLPQLTNQYRKLDLYHLLVLSTLLEECNVSRTAERLSVSQPAISKSLAKLRDVLEDPLFERGKGQLVPTERALSLKPKLERIFEQVNDVVRPKPFDPASDNSQITLAVVEFLQPILVPPLMVILAQEAPHLSLTIVSVAEGYQRHGEGKADFLLLYEEASRENRQHAALPGYERHPIMRDEYVAGLVRTHHALAKQTIDLDAFLGVSHLIPRITLPELNVAQMLVLALKRQNRRRQVVLGCNQLQVLLEVVRQGDHLLSLPQRVAEALERRDPGLDLVDLTPVHDALALPSMSCNLLSMERFKNSPVHQWLRTQILKILRQELLPNRI